jgi:cyclophilin family peptidyl-prolyl cis-trans isomerase
MQKWSYAVAVLLLGCLGLALIGCTEEKVKETTESVTSENNPVVVMETSMGTVEIELWAEQAPITVKNFLEYVDAQFYDGLIFHRVIEDFMIQGGGLTPDMQQKPPRAQIKNEARAELKNDRGTIAMARTPVVDSASSQFFINVKDNNFLNHRSTRAEEYGYAAFGKVIAGMDVVDQIRKTPTRTIGGAADVPIEPVIIKSIRRRAD